MSPIYFTVDGNLPLMIIPNVKVHLDGHTVLTYTYDIYFNENGQTPRPSPQNTRAIKDKADFPDYCGCITFERDNHFKYSADGAMQLSRGVIEEIIEKIQRYRQDTALWPPL